MQATKYKVNASQARPQPARSKEGDQYAKEFFNIIRASGLVPSDLEDFDQALAAKDPAVVSICRGALQMTMGEEYSEVDLEDLLQRPDANSVRWLLEASEEELAEVQWLGEEASTGGEEDYATSDEESS